jgi:hypothetical protein
MRSASKEHAILVYFTIAFSFIIISTAFTKITPEGNLSCYNPKIFNLLFYVPVTFWIGMFMLGALLFLLYLKAPKGVSLKLTKVLIVSSVIIILTAFYALPYLVEQNPRFVDSWVHGRTANGILKSGHLNLTEYDYQTYPLSFIALSVMSKITGINLIVWLRILPLMMVLLFFGFLIFFLNKLLKDLKTAAISVFVYGLSTFYLSFHFSPEIFGWLFLYLLLAIALNLIRNDAKSLNRKDALIYVLLVIGIAIAHPVTQLSAALILFVLFMLGAFWKVRYLSFNRLAISIVIFAGWAISFGYPYFNVIVKSFGIAFEKVSSEITSSIIARPLQETFPHEVTNLLLYRRAIYLLVLLMAFVGGFLFKKKDKMQFTLLFGLATSGALLLFLTAFGILPLERPIRIAFIPLSAFSAYLICQKKKLGSLLLLLFIITLPLNFASFYWGEASRMTHDWEISSAIFISDHFNGVALGGFKETSIWKFFGNFSKIYNDYYLYGTKPDVFNLTFIQKQSIELVYISQTTLQKELLSGRPLNVSTFIDSTKFNCISANGYSITLLTTKSNIVP